MGKINSENIKEDDVFITRLRINKVRHLGNIDIPLSETERKHLILTGKNGSGKTSVLQGLKTEFLDMMIVKAILMEESISDDVDDAFELEIEFNSNKLGKYFTSGRVKNRLILIPYCLGYDNNDNEEAERKFHFENIKKHVKKSSAFTAFKRWIIKDNPGLFKDFEQYFD